MKQNWDNLSIKEKEDWEKKAGQVNKAGLGLFTKIVYELLKDNILEVKGGKIVISGKYAFKVKQESGLNPDSLAKIINEKLREFVLTEKEYENILRQTKRQNS